MLPRFCKLYSNLTQEINIDKEIERVFQLLDKEEDKKLEVIRLYLLMHHGVRTSFMDKHGLATYLRTEEVDVDMLIGIYDVLDQTFSRGYPNFIFEFQLDEEVTLNNLKDKIEQCLPSMEEKSYKDDVFIFIKRIGIVTILDGSILKFPVTYEKFKEQVDFGGVKTKGESESRSTFDVIFDSVTRLCYIQCGDRNQSTAVHKVIQKHVTRTFKTFHPFSVSRKKRETVVENEYALDKQTIILLDFMQKSINVHNHEINDYLSVAFANKNQEKKVRSVRLSGNNLLESYEVGDRVRLGDQIKSVRFQLRFKTESDAYEIVTVYIDFQATLKIQYSNLQNTLNICPINRHLIATLTNSLNKLYKEQEVQADLNEIIAIAKVRDSAFLANVLGKIKDDVYELSIEQTDKTVVLEVINRYLIGE
ncbi:hypothetical protein ACEWK1_14035 [Metabacillus sp. YM-086]|uniref:hypothetical protein n=1 Tax=Metabacillus sp. YM-086 TaxID=3341729 RepID=UPI003A8696AB